MTARTIPAQRGMRDDTGRLLSAARALREGRLQVLGDTEVTEAVAGLLETVAHAGRARAGADWVPAVAVADAIALNVFRAEQGGQPE